MRAEAWALLHAGQLDAVALLIAGWQVTGRLDAGQWHLAGALALARGDLPRAAQGLQAALTLQAANVDVLYLLGRVMKEAGRLADAVDCYDRALAIDPGFWQAWSSRGIAARAAGLVQEAVVSFELALALRPDEAGLTLNLANALLGANEFERAAACYRQVLVLRPHDAMAARGLPQAMLGALLLEGRWREALDAAAALDPRFPLASIGAGIALARLDRADEATARFGTARALAVTEPVQCWGLGVLLEAQGRCHAEAVHWFSLGARLLGDAAGSELFTRIALAEMNLGALDAAEEAIARALARESEDANARWQAALIALWRDDYHTGFAGYEHRFRAVFAGAPGFTAEGRLPLGAAPWRGEPCEGRTLCVWAEQGLGDTLQFCRYLPGLAVGHAPAPLQILVQDELLSLLRASFPGLELHGLGDAANLPRPALEAAIMSLPLLLGQPTQTRPLPLPYLRPDPALVARWQVRLGPRHRFRVGLVWAGNPRHGRDLERSVPLAASVMVPA